MVWKTIKFIHLSRWINANFLYFHLVTSINLTRIKGGVENNVIPAEMSAYFDIRISVNTDLDAFEQQVSFF